MEAIVNQKDALCTHCENGTAAAAPFSLSVYVLILSIEKGFYEVKSLIYYVLSISDVSTIILEASVLFTGRSYLI